MDINIITKKNSTIIKTLEHSLDSKDWNKVTEEGGGFREGKVEWYQDGNLKWWAGKQQPIYFSTQVEAVHENIPYIEQLDLKFTPQRFANGSLYLQLSADVNFMAKRWQVNDPAQHTEVHYLTEEENRERFTRYAKFHINEDMKPITQEEISQFPSNHKTYHPERIMGLRMFTNKNKAFGNPRVDPAPTLSAILSAFVNKNYDLLPSFAPLSWMPEKTYSSFGNAFSGMSRDEAELAMSGRGAEHGYWT